MIGSIFEMTTLVDFLWHQLSCVEIECPARVGSVELGDKAVVAKLTNGVIVTGDLLMIAEGTGSGVRGYGSLLRARGPGRPPVSGRVAAAWWIFSAGVLRTRSSLYQGFF